MSEVVSKLAEIALVNLYYAEAELLVYGDDDARLVRVRQHIREAEAVLRVIAPDFVDGPPDAPDDAGERAA